MKRRGGSRKKLELKSDHLLVQNASYPFSQLNVSFPLPWNVEVDQRTTKKASFFLPALNSIHPVLRKFLLPSVCLSVRPSSSSLIRLKPKLMRICFFFFFFFVFLCLKLLNHFSNFSKPKRAVDPAVVVVVVEGR